MHNIIKIKKKINLQKKKTQDKKILNIKKKNKKKLKIYSKNIKILIDQILQYKLVKKLFQVGMKEKLR